MSSEEMVPGAYLLSLKHRRINKLKSTLIHNVKPGVVTRIHASGGFFLWAGRSTDRTWSCIPTLFSRFCDISEAKDMLAIKYETALCTPSVRRPTTMAAVRNLSCDRSKSFLEGILDVNAIRSQTTLSAKRYPSHGACTTIYVNKDEEQAIESVSLSTWSSFL